jgi:hypothetical protein
LVPAAFCPIAPLSSWFLLRMRARLCRRIRRGRNGTRLWCGGRMRRRRTGGCLRRQCGERPCFGRGCTRSRRAASLRTAPPRQGGLLCVVLQCSRSSAISASPMSNLRRQTFWLTCNLRGHHDHAGHRYWITSSAVANRVSGTDSPSALAALRLMTSSIFVTRCTGRSAGFSPLRMRPAYPPTMRQPTLRLTP